MLHHLNEEQRIAVMHHRGPALVLAGAGSGKTRVVTCRIAYLMEQGVDPSTILAVTFTNKAAKEMRDRVENMKVGTPPLICTFHSLGVRILRESIDVLGYSSSFSIYDAEESLALITQVCKQNQLSTDKETVHRMKNLISEAKNAMKGPEEKSEHAPPFFPLVYAEYQNLLQKSNACDFDDLLYLPVLLLEKYPSIRETLQRRWEYLLIDEYQDTNHAQYRLMKHLAQHNNIFVVGDPDQSIYAWRGAHVGNILRFEEEFPGTKVIFLEQNYRSRKNILDVSNALIRHNSTRYEKKLWSAREAGNKIPLFVGTDDRDEARFVARRIEHLYHHENIPFSQCAILYRTNSQSRSFEDALLHHRIPYQIIGGLSFYQRKEIKDILAYLHLIVSPFHTIAFLRAITTPKRGLGETTLQKIQSHAYQTNTSLIESCLSPLDLPLKKREALQSFVDLIRHLQDLATQVPLHALVLETIRSSECMAIYAKEKETFEERKENLDELIAKTAEWERLNPEGSLEDFLTELTLHAPESNSVGSDRVSLMTLHHVKGLEFMAVFLVGMEEDLLPHINAKEAHAVEEERRLCYVGITRAREQLFLSAARVRFTWGGYRSMRPSRFLGEIPKEYLEKVWLNHIAPTN